MHTPKPYGLFVEGGELTSQDRLFIDSLAKKVTNFKTVSRLESIKYTRALPDGGFVIIYDMGGIFKAIASKDNQQDQKTTDGIASLDVPMLYSGVIRDGRSFKRKGVSLELTDMCSRRLGDYSGLSFDRNQTLLRFAIPFSTAFRELEPEIAKMVDENNTLFSQYVAQYPTWYSGAMAEVMQIVGGYGKQNLNELPDDMVERALFKIPNEYLNGIKEKLKDVRLPAYTGIPDANGEFQYSYKFNKTHLVSFDEENNPWLIQIEPNNVWAMPLPMIPATTTAEFRAYVEYVGDHELEAILERFGGMPSGEVFPTGALFYSWVRAGVIVRVCDTADFYHYSAYSSACGWSCDSRGEIAVNTCYDFKGMFFYGYAYALTLNLAVADNHGLQQKITIENLTSQQLERVSNYISSLYALLQRLGDVRLPCLMYKLRRAELTDVLSLNRREATEADIEYWDNKVFAPIAQHSGRMVRTNEGYIYNGICLKLPEPFLKGCISMIWKPLNDGQPYVHPRCDTIVFAYFIGDELKVIKSFHDERNHINEVVGNFEEYMTVGSWEQVETQGLSGINGDYYSTDFDDRKEFAPTTTITKILGRDIGYGKPHAIYTAHFQMDGHLTRTKYYTHKTNIERSSGQFMRIAFVVNYYQRNMCTYFKRHSYLSSQSIESYKQYGAPDPNSYLFWTFDSGLHWSGMGMNPKIKQIARPYPKDSHPVWAEAYEYSHTGTALSDFADEGDWIGGLPADVSRYVNPPSGVTSFEYGGEPPPVAEYVDTVTRGAKHSSVCKLSILDRPIEVHKNAHADAIYQISPDENMVVLYLDACKVVFGNSVYANIDAYDNRYRFGYTRLADHKSAHFFIGVINE